MKFSNKKKNIFYWDSNFRVRHSKKWGCNFDRGSNSIFKYNFGSGIINSRIKCIAFVLRGERESKSLDRVRCDNREKFGYSIKFENLGSFIDLVDIEGGAFSFIEAHSIINEFKELEKNPHVIECVKQDCKVGYIKKVRIRVRPLKAVDNKLCFCKLVVLGLCRGNYSWAK